MFGLMLDERLLDLRQIARTSCRDDLPDDLPFQLNLHIALTLTMWRGMCRHASCRDSMVRERRCSEAIAPRQRLVCDAAWGQMSRASRYSEGATAVDRRPALSNA